MKPDWKDAPDWANWLAMDKDGDWYWYEYEPFAINGQDIWAKRAGKAMVAWNSYNLWDKSKEQRP